MTKEKSGAYVQKFERQSLSSIFILPDIIINPLSRIWNSAIYLHDDDTICLHRPVPQRS